MRPGEQTLDELYQEAKADLAKGGPELALKWAFKHARQVARRTRAEESAKTHEHDRFRASLELTGAVQAQAVQLLGDALYAAAGDVADARAAETACAHVQRLIERTPARAAAPAVHGRPKAAA